ncbi:flagellar hook-basal body complex protein FliE [Varunaivibrio sulfuroxidans]|uniref:Flagellar hook-basal body complex protein FliE n=1 Tax=Varunaivibrio sulfuroxidans TaxID=1773489 RepID=A0A4R3JCX2_9PROT|nr:flagellar hook-basal body complex protein FliE [Varunaivibrio sulfuroxidans]TCS63036.1 flagellar hook-basal body complex protein FliE [Varunaivibrio sulfuroxidans]WES31889.1 flagellar hook-basal body complex protein FliE [Varunaivibrio sulfuroxidans]
MAVTGAGTIANAINAYTQTARSASSGTSGPSGGISPSADKPKDGTFASLVKGAIDQAVQIGQKGEQASIAAIRDRADVTQVVTAVSEAELTLQTVVSVRDKVVDAYKEILRMPI